jgi:glutathione S-transferase
MMTLKLYAHPFSSYCQKALTALYENDTPFEFMMLDQEHAENFKDFAEMWPIRKFPLLCDDGRPVTEATTIIEYLQIHYPSPVKLLPEDPDKALEVRNLDRFFDNYISTPQQRVVANALRPEDKRDAYGVQEAKDLLDRAYGWLEKHMEGREWAAGNDFTLADCAAGPFLFYADWAHAIAPQFGNVIAYRKRLMARPSFKRAVDEARPYRKLFPLGAPDRD